MAESLDIVPPLRLSELVLNLFVDKLETKLEEMFKLWEEEPAYRIWQVLSAQKKHPQKLICLGGPAAGMGRYLARRKRRQVIIPPYYSIANAIGAAMAKPTLKLDYFADTERKTYSTNIGGLQGPLPRQLGNIEEAKKICSGSFHGNGKGLESTRRCNRIYL